MLRTEKCIEFVNYKPVNPPPGFEFMKIGEVLRKHDDYYWVWSTGELLPDYPGSRVDEHTLKSFVRRKVADEIII
jgi:hypothetical protein